MHTHTLAHTVRPRERKNSAAASASRLEHLGLFDPANSAQRGLCACVYIESLYIENRSGACSTRCYIRLSLLSQYLVYIQTDQRSGAFTVK